MRNIRNIKRALKRGVAILVPNGINGGMSIATIRKSSKPLVKCKSHVSQQRMYV